MFFIYICPRLSSRVGLYVKIKDWKTIIIISLQMLVRTLHTCSVKFPDVATSIVPLVSKFFHVIPSFLLSTMYWVILFVVVKIWQLRF